MTIVGTSLVACERVVLDSETRMVTLQGLVDTITSTSFPTLHPRFALCGSLRWEGPMLEKTIELEYRFVRIAHDASETEIAVFPGTWRANTLNARVHANYQFLKLHRPERVTFRLDHRITSDAWTPGPICTVDILEHTLDENQRKALVDTYESMGLTPPRGLRRSDNE